MADLRTLMGFDNFVDNIDDIPVNQDLRNMNNREDFLSDEPTEPIEEPIEEPESEPEIIEPTEPEIIKPTEPEIIEPTIIPNQTI